MPQFRTIPRTIEAEQFDGTNQPLLKKWGVKLATTGSFIAQDAHGVNHLLVIGDWLVKTADGFIVIPDADFSAEYVGANPADRQEVVFKMTTTGGEKVVASIYGWKNGRDAAYALMHIGKPEVVLEFLKEQVNSGDMSMLSLMNELAAKANPGE